MHYYICKFKNIYIYIYIFFFTHYVNFITSFAVNYYRGMYFKRLEQNISKLSQKGKYQWKFNKLARKINLSLSG